MKPAANIIFMKDVRKSRHAFRGEEGSKAGLV
jgi:hypothetical protein